jgi:hypothetical protein
VLRDQGCDLAQGFHVSRPLPGRELGRLIVAHEAARISDELPEPPRALRVVGGGVPAS